MTPKHVILVPPDPLDPLVSTGGWGATPPLAVEWDIVSARLVGYTRGRAWFPPHTLLPGHPRLLRRGLVIFSEGMPVAGGMDRLWRTFPQWGPTEVRTLALMISNGHTNEAIEHLIEKGHQFIYLNEDLLEIVRCFDCRELTLLSEAEDLEDPAHPAYSCPACFNKTCRTCGEEECDHE